MATPAMNGSGGKNAKLAALLRECAEDVERNQLTPAVMQAWGVLHIYVKERGGAPTKVTTSTTRIPRPPSEAKDTNPFDEEEHDDGNKKPAIPTDAFPASASAGFESLDEAHNDREGEIANKHKDHFGLGGLGIKFGKWGGTAPTKSKQQTSAELAQKSATSKKNAERARADLADLAAESEQEVAKHRAQARDGGHGAEDEWCEEHFTMGCGCKIRKQGSVGKVESSSSAEEAPPPTPAKPAGSTHTLSTAASSTTPITASASQESFPSRPAFQRPVNPKSTLIANGWIEQQRRSKMRTVWKEILASLVEGRKPGEETTLWVQRQVTNPQTGKAELEALHQIPMKWLESVKYLDFYSDHRFSVKVYNVAEEFMFRCADEDSAQNWVLTLRSVSEIAQRNNLKARVEANQKRDMGLDNLDDWDATNKESKGEEQQQSPSSDSTSPHHKMTVRELRAIAHGAGYKTSGMERGDLERLVAGIASQRTNQQKDAAVEEQRRHQGFVAEQVAAAEKRRQEEEEFRHHEEEARKHHMAEAELRAKRQEDEEKRRVAAAEAEQRRQALEAEHKRAEEQRRRKAEEEQRRVAAAEEEQRKQALAAERKRVEEERRAIAEEKQRRLVAEQQAAELRRRQAEEAQRQRQAEEAQRRRLAEQQAAEQRKRQEEEQRRRLAEQQAAEQRRRQEEEQRMRMAEQQFAEQQRKQEEEQRRRQQEWQAAQWQQQRAAQAAANRDKWNKQWQAQQQQQQQHNQQAFHGQQQGHAQQQPQQPFHQSAGPPPGAHRAAPGARPPPPPTQASPASLKYAKMKDQSDDDSQANITAIKRNILMHWALQPPMLQMLRPVDVLITTIHSVFPPAFGVKGHVYFEKWTPIPRDSLLAGAGMGNSPDEAKLKKAVRKIRFFLHPDKLPRDFNDEQAFMCKMLWDITSDAFEEFHKKNEELDWIRS